MPETQTLIEPLNRGLVTARPPSLLQPGELSKADGCSYEPYSQSLHKSPANATWSTSDLGADVTGLVYCAFDFAAVNTSLVRNNITIDAADGTFAGISVGASVRGNGIPDGTVVATVESSTQLTLSAAATLTGDEELLFDADDVLIAQANSKYQLAKAGGASGTFADLLTGVTEGTTLTSIHYANEHVLLNGLHENRILKASQITRQHGMLPVTATPETSTTTGTWALASGIGWYAYWTTEYDSTNELESDFQGKPAPVNIDTISKKAIITRPPQVNGTADRWRVYRSLKMSATSQEGADKENVALNGVLVAEAEIIAGEQQTIEDGGGVTSTSALPAAAVATVGVGLGGLTWNNTTAITGAADANNATIVNPGSPSYRYSVPIDVGTFGFNTSAINPPVTGITVVVRAKKGGDANLTCQLIKLSDALPYQDKILPKKVVPVTVALADHTLGGASDDWISPTYSSINWVPSDFADAKFLVRLTAYVTAPGDSIEVDAVTVSVSYGKAQQEGSTTAFPIVTVKPFGETIVVGRNGPPPKATTGAIFENSLVLNDVTDKSIAWYSFPDSIDAFPSQYYLNVESEDEDEITQIVSLGEMLALGLRSRVYRVNHLPRASDAEFDRGRAVQLLTKADGPAGRRAGCVATFGDGNQWYIFVGRTGLYYTDLYRLYPLAPDLNWDKLVEKSALPLAILEDNTERQELLFYYVPKGSGTPTILTRRMRFPYHHTHLREGGGLKAIGPDTVNVLCSTIAVLANGERPHYTGDASNDYVYLENQGAGSTMDFEGREIYANSVGGEWKLKEIYAHYRLLDFSAASPMNLSTIVNVKNLGSVEVNSATATEAILAYADDGSAYPEDGRLLKFYHGIGGEAMTINALTNSATHRLAVDYFVLKTEGLGREQT